jgi:hypothetical protein
MNTKIKMILTNITTSFELRPEADSTRMVTEGDNPENVDASTLLVNITTLVTDHFSSKC